MAKSAGGCGGCVEQARRLHLRRVACEGQPGGAGGRSGADFQKGQRGNSPALCSARRAAGGPPGVARWRGEVLKVPTLAILCPNAWPGGALLEGRARPAPSRAGASASMGLRGGRPAGLRLAAAPSQIQAPGPVVLQQARPGLPVCLQCGATVWRPVFRFRMAWRRHAACLALLLLTGLHRAGASIIGILAPPYLYLLARPPFLCVSTTAAEMQIAAERCRVLLRL
ncbi:unnamed protein product [Amoebophrya sp. A120]|nr:unnamed protein product [Amoebophrya sp. A120]|eukprot:GSA120T00011294001.1